MHKRAKSIAKNGESAFTLIEVMVSVSLFLIVMMISLGAVLAIVDGNKKTQAINSVSNNLNSAIESMVRDIKTGYAYTCADQNVTSILSDTDVFAYSKNSSTCNATNENVTTYVSFISTISGDKRWVKYYLDTTTIPGKGSIYKTFCPASNLTCPAGNYISVAITSPDIDIQALEFRIRRPVTATAAISPTDSGQPSVFILLKGTAFVNKTKVSDFSMQSFVSQRVLNI